jgi:hypothetical protein
MKLTRNLTVIEYLAPASLKGLQVAQKQIDRRGLFEEINDAGNTEDRLPRIGGE